MTTKPPIKSFEIEDQQLHCSSCGTKIAGITGSADAVPDSYLLLCGDCGVVNMCENGQLRMATDAEIDAVTTPGAASDLRRISSSLHHRHTAAQTPRFCCVCKRTEEERGLRPYGKGGKPICLPCAEADPVRLRELRRRMQAQQDKQAAGGEPLMFTPDGPVSTRAFVNADGGVYRPGQTIAAVTAVAQPGGGYALVASTSSPVDMGIATVIMCKTLLSVPQAFPPEVCLAAAALVAALRGDTKDDGPMQVIDQRNKGPS